MRLLCVSTSKNTDAILEKVVDLSGGEIELALHIGSKEADVKASSFSRMVPRGTKKNAKNPMIDSKFYGKAHELMFAAGYEENLATFIDHLNRDGEGAKFRSHNLSNVHDYLDYYHVLIDLFFQMVVEKKITHVLFFNVPHLTYDTVFYQVAKALNLPTIIVTQSLFPNKFLSLKNVEDYGSLQFDANSEARFEIKSEPEDLFYMKGIKQGESETGKLNAKAVVNILLFLILQKPLSLFNLPYVYRLFQRASIISQKLPKWRDPFGRFFNDSSFEYFDHLLEFENKPVDLDTRFVYFPLHLQPEMTTSSLGGVYKDQALAIEKLAMMLPEGVKVYVKENPKQGAFMRGPLFFYRLKRLANVEFLPSYTSTHELLAKSEFVATITGTVGWEALQKGKKVLVFGNTWYMNFPGAVQYSDDLEYEQVVNSNYKHGEVESAMGQLLEQAHSGVVDRHYKQLVPEFDQEQNDTEVAKTIINLLKGKAQPVFRR